MRLCRASGVYPRHLELQKIRYNSRPVASGGFGDIWRGYYSNYPICLKVAKAYEGSDVEHLIEVNLPALEIALQLMLLPAGFHERGGYVEPPQPP